MKKSNLFAVGLFSAILIAPVVSQADDFDQAVRAATAEIDKAKAVNYEWRDSRKMLEKATKLNKEGKNDKAMKLVAKAKSQGQLAVVQAELQAGVNDPHH